MPESSEVHLGSPDDASGSFEQHDTTQNADRQLPAQATVNPGTEKEGVSILPVNVTSPTPPEQAEEPLGLNPDALEKRLVDTNATLGVNTGTQKPADRDTRRLSTSSQNRDQGIFTWLAGQSPFRIARTPSKQDEAKGSTPVCLIAVELVTDGT